ncbi:MAG: hypothetical protein HW419_4350 [Deltaproteobacteria bacterium]|nr:hypothetical protein [Deltaproteobacteria bacterium]
MAVDVKASLRQEINRFRRAIAEKTSELASLNDGLRRHERALALLGNGAARARTQPAKTRRSALVSWDAVLAQLPNSFTVKDITKRPESKGRLPVYLRKVAAKWAKRGKTKRVSPGKYQKVEQKKLRAT